MDQRRFDYERSDIDSAAVAAIAAGLAVFVITVPLVMPLAFPQTMRHITSRAPPALSSDAPPLEVAPRDTLRQKQESEKQIAETYGWTDRDHGVVRIPVSRASALLVQRGRSGWPSP